MAGFGRPQGFKCGLRAPALEICVSGRASSLAIAPRSVAGFRSWRTSMGCSIPPGGPSSTNSRGPTILCAISWWPSPRTGDYLVETGQGTRRPLQGGRLPGADYWDRDRRKGQAPGGLVYRDRRKAGVYYAASDDRGKSFSKPLALLTDTWVPYADVKLAVDGDDAAWVAFEARRDDRAEQVTVVRIDRQGSVSSRKSWQGSAPDIAAQGKTAVVAWVGAGGEIQIVRVTR